MNNPATGALSTSMSATQRSMWLHDQLQPTSVAHRLGFAFRIVDHLDTAVFEAAVQAVADRHDVLRSSFVDVDGEPQLQIRTRINVEIEQVPVTDWGSTKVNDFVEQWITSPYDLAKDQLFRFAILSSSPTDHLVVFAVHHLLVDLWSLALLFAEISNNRVWWSFRSSGRKGEVEDRSARFGELEQRFLRPHRGRSTRL